MQKKKLAEALRFVVAGGAGFLVEMGALIAFKEGLGLDTLIAAPVAFLISVIVNYLICVKWVWPDADAGSGAVKLGFLLTSVIGLVLNEGFMLLFRWLFGEETVLMQVFGRNLSMYMVNKVLATMLVTVWNYFTKKAMLQTDLLSGFMRKHQKEK